MSWIRVLLGVVVLGLALSYIVIPLTVQLLSSFRIRATQLSPFSVRGLEWRHQRHASTSLPTLRIDRIRWSWGGSTPTSFLTLRVEGVTLRIPKKSPPQPSPETHKDDGPAATKPTQLSDAAMQRLNKVLHILLPHWSTFASLFSIRVSNIRVFAEEVPGLQISVKAIRFGISRTLSYSATPTSRPDMGPRVDSLSSTPTGANDHPGQAANGGHHDESLSSRVTHTASRVWSNTIGSNFDRIVLTSEVVGTNILLAGSDQTKPVDGQPQQPPDTLAKSQVSESSAFETLKRSCQPVPTADDAVYEQVVGTEEATILTLSFGIGPNVSILSECNISTSITVGAVQLNHGALERLFKVLKESPAPPKSSNKDTIWAPQARPRVVLRAFDTVSASLSRVSIIRRLPVLTATGQVAEKTLYNTLTLDITDIKMMISGARPNTDPYLSTYFGRNSSPESLVRGARATLGWSTIELQCSTDGVHDTPGETTHHRPRGSGKVQLCSLNRTELEVVSTWRPSGWTRNELLFAGDLNLSLVSVRGLVDSINVNSDIQLCFELMRGWRYCHPRNEVPSPSTPKKKVAVGPVPRFRLLLEVGKTTVVMANGESQSPATMTLGTNGFSLGGTSNYVDFAPPSTWNRTVGEDAGSVSSDVSDSVPADNSIEGATIPPQQPAGDNLSGDPATSAESARTKDTDGQPASLFRFESFIRLQPVTLHMSLGHRNEKTFRIASLGRMEANARGNIGAPCDVREDGSEYYWLDSKTLDADVEVIVDDGVRVELWNPQVLDALIALCHLTPQGPPSKPKRSANILERLPAGVSVRLSAGRVSVFLGSKDINPECMSLIRGLWLQTTVVCDYANYATTKNLVDGRNTLRCVRDDMRHQFNLFDNLTAKAFGYAKQLELHGGQAALFTVLVRDTTIRPVFNGEKFVSKGGVDRVSVTDQPDMPPRPTTDAEFRAWGSGEARRNERQNCKETIHPPNVDVAVRAFLRIPYVFVTGRVHRKRRDADLDFYVSARIQLVHVMANLTDVYCTLLAIQTLRQIGAALKRPDNMEATSRTSQVESQKAVSARNLTYKIYVPTVWVHASLPLKEPIFLSTSRLNVEKEHGKVLKVTTTSVLWHIRSPTCIGFWDEFGRIKAMEVHVDLQNAILIKAKGLRIRIPHSFVLANLILNINILVKLLKLLLSNLKTGEYKTYRLPESEGPKLLPNMKIHVDLLHLEFRDNPVEVHINLANRVGLMEQRRRLELEDLFDQKTEMLKTGDVKPGHTLLSMNSSVKFEEARWRLDWHLSRSWIKRIDRAKNEQRRREDAIQTKMKVKVEQAPPIHILPLERTTPLFRTAFSGVDVHISPPTRNRAELIKYMGDLSTPFQDDVEFTLMVPFQLHWAMDEAKMTLRDYPLPLLRIQPAKSGPAWRVNTLFVIAEELAGFDTCRFFPAEVMPAGVGHLDAKPLELQAIKTLNPVKTYARPIVQILTEGPTNLTWCKSYSPGFTDISRIMDTITLAVKDPSPRIGFWDKMRLILHWRVTMDFTGSVRFYFKGSTDPYYIDAHGAGFALIWRRNVRCEIGQPNKQGELVQLMAEECLVTIPDLTALHDAAAIGTDVAESQNRPDQDRDLILKRATKPCARFLNGIRFGLGFQFERTCRPWSCEHNCGDTENLLHRQCRIFTFKPHQGVTLRMPDAIDRITAEQGHPIDSYEGFRSDYIHFSISVVAPRDSDDSKQTKQTRDSETTSSLYLSPKAFAHFNAWWKLFGSKIPAPIRMGKLFPDTPPPSTKFGRSLATLKYRLDLRPVYVSHAYHEFSKELREAGKSQSVGWKLRVGHLRVDGHQRMQEKREWSERLNRVKTITHKSFYAVDCLLEDMEGKCISAYFNETHAGMDSSDDEGDLLESDSPRPHASQLPPELKQWFNFFDYIDCDWRPFDRDPRIQITHLCDCPYGVISRRVKARITVPSDDDENDDDVSVMEASKFGHEKTHVCYLGAAPGIGPTQSRIAQGRIDELKVVRLRLPAATAQETERSDDIRRQIDHRISTLEHHIHDLAQSETRHVDDNTLEADDSALHCDDTGELPFEITIHMHCPRFFFNSISRNTIYKYKFSWTDRRREEWATSHLALRNIRDGISARIGRKVTGLNEDDHFHEPPMTAAELLKELETAIDEYNPLRFKPTFEYNTDQEDLARANIGLPAVCKVHPKFRALVFKPQIALRSTADPNAILLLAVEEISFKGFAVRDFSGVDRYTADVLSRNYLEFKGLQGFYPTHEILSRPRDQDGIPKELDFIPLEIFLDVRSESTDYERIVLKTDISLSFDNFNDLRVPRGMEWPQVEDELGKPITHLRKHQDLTIVAVPMVTVSATSSHFAALYYIVTDLFMYTDPQKAARSKKIDSYALMFDPRDRDPHRLMYDILCKQQKVRSLSAIKHGYEQNIERLSEEGKRELFSIRGEVVGELEDLFTTFEAISTFRSKTDSLDQRKNNSRVDVRAGNIAWHMQRDNHVPLLKLNVKHTLASIIFQTDGAKDIALCVGDLQALNSNADALYPEVLSRCEKGGSTAKAEKSCFVSVSISVLPAVGGIAVIGDMALDIHPVRFKLEEEVGRMIMTYIKNERTRGNVETTDDTASTHSGVERSSIPSSTHTASSSHSTLSSTLQTSGDPRVPEHESNPAVDESEKDAAEMRRRASNYRTFYRIVVSPSHVVLDYKRDLTKKRHLKEIPDVVNFILSGPELEYHNKIWETADLIDAVRRDIWNYVWSQRSDILGQIIKKTSVFRSKKGLRQVAGIETDVPWSAKKSNPKSPLRFTVQPATPLDVEDASGGVALSPAISARSEESIIRSASRGDDTSTWRDGAPTPGDEADAEDEGGSRRQRRGLFSKLKRGGKNGEQSNSGSARSSVTATPERTIPIDSQHQHEQLAAYSPSRLHQTANRQDSLTDELGSIGDSSGSPPNSHEYYDDDALEGAPSIVSQ